MPPRTLRHSLPEGLEHVILKCLEKRREDRFQSVKELAEALLPFGNPWSPDRALRIAHTLASSNWTVRQTSQADHLPHGSTITTPPEPKVSVRRHLGYWALGGVFLAAITCLGLAANAAARQSREAAATTSPVVSPLELAATTENEPAATDAGHDAALDASPPPRADPVDHSHSGTETSPQNERVFVATPEKGSSARRGQNRSDHRPDGAARTRHRSTSCAGATRRES